VTEYVDFTKRRLNILFISQYFHPEPFSNNEIARSLVIRGHDVEVVCCVPNYPEGAFYPSHSNKARRRERWEGISILRARTVARGRGALTLLLNYVVYPVAALATIARHGRGSYSVSFTSMPSPIFQCIVAVAYKWFCGVPAVYWVQDIWPESLFNTINLKSRVLRGPIRSLCAFLYQQADFVLVQSEAFRPALEIMGVDSDKIGFLPNSAPDDFFPLSRASVDPVIAALVPKAPLQLMFAGNIGESQNLDVIIDAARRLRGRCAIQWTLVGSGRDFDRLVKVVGEARLEDIINFAGHHPISTMPAFYALADAMIISLKNTEIFRMTVPYKLQTYLSAGKPVIGSISGETKRIIEASDAGFCADAGDVEALCNSVLQFAALSEKQRAVMSQNARAYFVEHYSASRVFDVLEQQLLKLAKL
jgi:colanic acid biosynthesis glycosyl transferase WcaI